MSDWSSDGCATDREHARGKGEHVVQVDGVTVEIIGGGHQIDAARRAPDRGGGHLGRRHGRKLRRVNDDRGGFNCIGGRGAKAREARAGKRGGTHVHSLRSEEHTSELQSLMRISYAVFCLNKKKK